MKLILFLYLSYIKPKVNFLLKEILAPKIQVSETTAIAYLSGPAAGIL